MRRPLHIFSETGHQSNQQTAAGYRRNDVFTGAPGRPKGARNRSNWHAARRLWPGDLSLFVSRFELCEQVPEGQSTNIGIEEASGPVVMFETLDDSLVLTRPAYSNGYA
jgi:hypothetical protein